MDRTTETLASYAASLSHADLTPAAIHQTKRRVIDALGCAMGGYLSEPSAIARRLAGMYTSTLPARVLGSGQLTSPDMAAFANTVMVRYLDGNDTYTQLGGGHPSDMIPAVLALADPRHASGAAVILGIVTAYEMFGALADLIPIREKGWDQGTFVVVGGAVGAGKILGLNQEQMAHAISLAITPNIPTRQTRAGELSRWKGCATAAAVRNGVFAALLAAEGMTGPYEPFEGRHGIWEQVTGPFQLQPLGGAEKPFTVETSNLKFFPSEYHSQAPLWTALEIRQKVKPEDIDAINVQTYWLAYSEIGSEPQKWDPQTRETADHSLAYLLAVALQDGAVTPASFTLERIRDANLRPLMNKISIRENVEFTRQYPEALRSEIEVITTSGERLVEQVSYPKGHRRNPMSDAEVADKFLGLCQAVLTPPQCQSALDTLWRLEEVQDIGEVLDLFQVS
jgi:2-methylcitrate dehydratase